MRNLTRAITTVALSLLLYATTRATAQTEPTCVVSGTVLDLSAQPVANATVKIRTVAPAVVGSIGFAVNDLTTKTNASGVWSLTLRQALNAQIDIPAVSLAKDFVVPSGLSCPAAFGSLTLYNRGSLTPATILSDHGPSFGGDLTGSSPNPSVIALRGQPLYAELCTAGQARVYDAGTASFRCQAVGAGVGVQSVSGGTGVTITGTASAPVVNVSTAGVGSSQLAAGAAATNVGALGGDLTGTLPSPQIAAGTIVNSDINAAAAIGWAKIDKTGAIAGDVGAVALGTGLTGITAGTGITVTGAAPSPTVSISSGGVGASQLGSGAAATNVGTLGGDLTGSTLPNPLIASGVVTNAHVNASAAIAQSKIAGLATALSLKEDTANKAQPSGYASLDGGGKVPAGQLPAVTPAAHAASHASVGSDPVSAASIGAANSSHTHPESEVVSLVSDLADRGRISTPNTWASLQTFNGGISVPGGFTPGGPLTVAAGNPIRIALATPSGVVATPSASGGTLASGTYYYVVTARDGSASGETVASGEVSAAVTGPTGSVGLTWTAVPGASYRVYRGTAPGTENTYYTSATNSYTDTGSSGSAGSPPGSASAYAVAFAPTSSSWVIGGSLGIGKAAPGTALDVAGTVTASSFVGPLTGTASGNPPSTRAIATTGPLTGGGDLSADRTHGCPTCVTSAASLTSGGVVYGAGGQASAATAAGTGAQTLHGGATPTWAAIALGSDVSGVLGPVNGGLGVDGSAATGFPKFAAGTVTIGALAAGDVPNHDAAKITTGQLALARGGTGADLSATGGTGQFVRQSGAGTALTVSTIAAADLPATLTSNTSGTAAGFTGSLSGDVTGGQASTAVAAVGGQTAANVAAGAVLANAATSANTATAIVRRDASGNFSAGTINGNVSGTAANVTGVIALANGGTGQTSASSAFDALAPTTTKGDLVARNATTNTRFAVCPNGQALIGDSATATGWNCGTSGTGSVTSVGLTAPGIFSVSGSPVTGSGTLALSLVSQSANQVWGTTGAGTPSFIALTSSHLPATITSNTSGSAASFTGSLTGDVIGTQGATVVSTVGGASAANVATATAAANAATATNTASTIVKRDGSGGFAAGAITATGLVATAPGASADAVSAAGPGTPRLRVQDTTAITGGSIRLQQSGQTTTFGVYNASDSLVASPMTLDATAATAPFRDKGGAVFNVRAYGATGDGTTNDTSAINAAISAAGSAAGTVYFPPGTYQFSTLTLSNAGIRLVGAGPANTTLRTTSTSGIAITLAATDQAVEKLTLAVSGTALAGHRALYSTAQRGTYRDLSIVGAYDAIRFSSTASYQTIDNVTTVANAAAGSALIVDAANYVSVRGFSVRPGGSYASAAIYFMSVSGNSSLAQTTIEAQALYGIRMDDATNITISDSYVNLTGSPVANSRALYLTGNTAEVAVIGSVLSYAEVVAELAQTGGVLFTGTVFEFGQREDVLHSWLGAVRLVNCVARTASRASAGVYSTVRLTQDSRNFSAYGGSFADGKYGFEKDVLADSWDLDGVALSGATGLANSLLGPDIASANTITLTTRRHRVTGTASIRTINPPPYGATVTLIPSGAWTLSTAGNIAVDANAAVGIPITLVWSPSDAKWYPSNPQPLTTATSIASSVSGTAGAGTPLLKVGDNGGGSIGAPAHYGIGMSQAFGNAADANVSYAGWIEGKRTSGTGFSVGVHAAAYSSVGGAEGMAGTAQVDCAGACDMNTTRGAYLAVTTSGNGNKTATDVYGDWTRISLGGAGTVSTTNLHGKYVDLASLASLSSATWLNSYAGNAPSGGTFTNYATFHAPDTGISNASRWGVYSDGGRNYLAGSLGVGTAAPGTNGQAAALAFVLTASANSSTATWGSWTEEVTLSTSGTTTDSTNDLPANSLILGVACRVTATISTATAWAAGDATTSARFIASAANLTSGTTVVGLQHWKGSVASDAAGPTQSSAAKLRFTTVGTPTAGKIRCTVSHATFVAPTS